VVTLCKNSLTYPLHGRLPHCHMALYFSIKEHAKLYHFLPISSIIPFCLKFS
jgi:hypothetical protein